MALALFGSCHGGFHEGGASEFSCGVPRVHAKQLLAGLTERAMPLSCDITPLTLNYASVLAVHPDGSCGFVLAPACLGTTPGRHVDLGRSGLPCFGISSSSNMMAGNMSRSTFTAPDTSDCTDFNELPIALEHR